LGMQIVILKAAADTGRLPVPSSHQESCHQCCTLDLCCKERQMRGSGEKQPQNRRSVREREREGKREEREIREKIGSREEEGEGRKRESRERERKEDI
jgi:hypothetical protein